MSEAVRELISRRDLLYMVAWREIKIRYKQSIMGLLWAVLLPMIIIAAGIVVRYGMSELSGASITAVIVAGVSVKSLAWAFFAGTMRFSSTSLIANANLVTKIYMPREIFPIAAVLSQLFDLAIASAILAVGLLLLGIGASWHLIFAPFLVAAVVALAAGWALIISAACLFFRDVKYLVEVFITFAIFITPVFYDVEIFGHWAQVLLLNPLAPLLEALEACIVYHRTPDTFWVSYSAAVAAASVVAGFIVFKRWEPSFAEKI